MKANLKAQQRIESKQRILNVASRLFKKNGYSATGIDQIMNEAGLTAGAFYAHFKSKQDLFEHCLEYSLQQSRTLLFQGTENLHGDELINQIMSRYVSSLHRDLVERGCILPSIAAEIHRESKKTNALIAKYLEAWVQMIADNLRGVDDASLRRQKAVHMVSAAVGSILLSRMTKGFTISDELLQAPT